MNHIIKNITLTFSFAIYIVIVLSGSGGSLYTTHAYISTSYLSYCETTARTESSDSQPELVSEKPISLIVKVDMQTGFIVPYMQFPSIRKFVIVKSTSPYRLSPQIVYVRYLPRDPPKV